MVFNSNARIVYGFYILSTVFLSFIFNLDYFLCALIFCLIVYDLYVSKIFLNIYFLLSFILSFIVTNYLILPLVNYNIFLLIFFSFFLLSATLEPGDGVIVKSPIEVIFGKLGATAPTRPIVSPSTVTTAYFAT